MKASFATLLLNANTSRAARAMSMRVALSLSCGINDLRRLQYVTAANPVLAAFYGTAAYQINITLQQSLQFLFHLDVVKQTPFGVRRKRNQQVNVAISSKVVAEGRAKQSQFGHFPTAAEFIEHAALVFQQATHA